MFDLLRPETVVCPFCKATAADGVVRTLRTGTGSLSVTWHVLNCPHYAADRILAENEG
ncbi:hypothetical protein ACIF8W_16880 [Streptomyces sp. NPDC085639]|uniref:hypothetical protein n=1 Tax=Streptomyces sp. NPDC085639 TaxID=3365734 RepID=UPI0037D2CDCF